MPRPTWLRRLPGREGHGALLPLAGLLPIGLPLAAAPAAAASGSVLFDIAAFFGEAGAFVFGSGLASVPFRSAESFRRCAG